MRFIFKTAYEQDIRLAKHEGHVFWYSVLGLFLAAAPWLLPEYWLAQLTFVLIYAVVGLGLMLLAGFTGLFSIGHAAFLGVGAYTQAVLTNAGWPFPLALAVAGPVLYFQGGLDGANGASKATGTLHALDMASGTRLWSYTRPATTPSWSFHFLLPVDGALWADTHSAMIRLQ